MNDGRATCFKQGNEKKEEKKKRKKAKEGRIIAKPSLHIPLFSTFLGPSLIQ